MLLVLVLLGTIAGAWYLLIVRPQRDQQSRHGLLVDRLQVGDHVLTVGGIYGRVAALDGSSVLLELAPGLTSRIATDGIARIVQGGEVGMQSHATDGSQSAQPTPRQAMDTDMHQHPDPQQAYPQQPQPQQLQQPHAQHVALPPQPFAPATAAPSGYAPHPEQQPHLQQQAVHQHHHQQPVQVQPPAHGATTFRAQVSAALPTFEPRPWADVAPRPTSHAPAFHQVEQHQGQAMPQLLPPMPQLVTPQQYAAQPQQQPQYGAHPQPPQQYAAAPAQPMPIHAPFAAQAAPTPTPLHHAQPHHPQFAVQPGWTAVQQPVEQTIQIEQVTAAPAQVAAERRHSRAPQGMGSSLRLDDPTLQDTMTRARSERAELAEEYRRLTAPLVATEEAPMAQVQALPTARGLQQHGHPAPQLVGHDTSGAPLFAMPGIAGVQPLQQYPMPAQVPVHPGAAMHPRSTIPRPVVDSAGPVDPALQRSAFQRPTPYASGQAQSTAAHEQVPVHALG